MDIASAATGKPLQKRKRLIGGSRSATLNASDEVGRKSVAKRYPMKNYNGKMLKGNRSVVRKSLIKRHESNAN